MSIVPGRKDIFDAASHDDYLEVKNFLEKEAILPNSTNSLKQTAGHIAAKNGNLRIVKLLLSHDTSILGMKDRWNQTMVHLATQKGALKVIKCLIEEHGADYLEPNRLLQNVTVLHIAAAMGHLSALKYFIQEKNMNVNVRNSAGQPPAFNAAANSRIFVIKFFGRETEANFTAVDNHGDNILYMSAKMGDLLAPKYLVNEKKVKFDFNWRNNLGETIVNRAVVYDQPRFIKYFVEEMGADVNIADNEGSTPLHEAAVLNDYVLVRYLVHHGADPELKNKQNKTAAQMTTDKSIMAHLEEAVRNRALVRSPRSVKKFAPSFVPSSLRPTGPAIYQRIDSTPWRRLQDGTRNSNFVESSVNFFYFNNLLFVLANICFGYSARSRYQRAENLSLLSPREILHIKMDSFALKALDAWSNYSDERMY